jgi:DNA-binding transcriptional LysR family regulator
MSCSRRKDEHNRVVLPLEPRLLIDDMLSLKHAAIAGVGVVALPGYVCRDDVKSGALRRVLTYTNPAAVITTPP